MDESGPRGQGSEGAAGREGSMRDRRLAPGVWGRRARPLPGVPALAWEDLVAAAGRVAPRHRFVDEAAGLEAILDPSLNLVAWRRTLDQAFAAWLREQCRAVDFRVQAEVSAASPEVAELVAPLPASAHRDALAADLAALVVRFGALADAPRVLATFGVVAHDMCQRFHVDAVGLRGLCTYAGDGTEWVPEPEVVRAALGARHATLAASNRAVAPAPGAVRSLDAGWFGIIKGDAWPGNRGRGAVHRSPPAGTRGVRRLLLKLDVDPDGRLRQ